MTLRIGTTTSHGGSASKENSQDGTDVKKKFTTSNFTETVVTESDPVFGVDSVKTTTASETSKSSNKKRKSSVGSVTPPVKSGELEKKKFFLSFTSGLNLYYLCFRSFLSRFKQYVSTLCNYMYKSDSIKYCFT